MTKRPDQYQMDQDDSGASDYKWRRKSEENVDREGGPNEIPANQVGTQTPNEAMETSREASEKGRREELDRARDAGNEKKEEEKEKEEADNG